MTLAKNQLREQKPEELEQTLAQEREKLRQLRFNLISGKVKNIREIRFARKNIARILTILRQKSSDNLA